MNNAEIARELVVVKRGVRGWEIRLPGVAGLAKLKTKIVPKTRAQAETAADYFRSHVRAILDRADAVRTASGQKAAAGRPQRPECVKCGWVTANTHEGKPMCDDCRLVELDAD